MVFDCLENAHLYYGLGSGISTALKRLKKGDLQNAPDGKYESGCDDVYFNVSHYLTRDPDWSMFEAHHQYVDIQYIAQGTEVFALADVNTLAETQPYSETADRILLKGEPQQYITVPEGWFLILFPRDAHVACLKKDGHAYEIKKILGKARLIP